MSDLSFRECVHLQIQLLQSGKPLEAFNRFFAPKGVMYANGSIFATNASEGFRKQEPYISSAKEINGLILDLTLSEKKDICIFRNKTSFISKDGSMHQIDGLCWQQWTNGQIIIERYYDGQRMHALISDGIFDDLDMLCET